MPSLGNVVTAYPWAMTVFFVKRIVKASLIGGVFLAPFIGQAQLAGGSAREEHLPVSAEVREQRMMHVSPHILMFDGTTPAATIELSNVGDKPVTADIQVLCAFMDYPRNKTAEAALFSPHWETLMPHDTVLLSPKPSDRCANAWVSGLPPQLTLAPKEKKSFTVKVNAPGGLSDGEYTARLVTIVRPPEPNRNKGKPKDERTIYSLPIKGETPPMLRDSTEIAYRKGTITMGIAAGADAIAMVDTIGLGGPDDIGSGSNRLWIRLPLKVTGNAPFRGVLHYTLKNVETGAESPLIPGPMILYRDAVTHWWNQVDHLPPGKYEAIFTIDAPQDNIPEAKRVHVTPLVAKLPFVKKN